MDQPPLLRVRDLTTEFQTERGRLRAVDGISFDVHTGETLAIVGESGSGKSVTALSLLRLVASPPAHITATEITFAGENLLGMSDAAIRRIRGNRIAMIFQEPMTSLNPSLSIGTQVGEPLNEHQGTPWDKAIAAAAALLSKVRVPDATRRVKSWPHLFSGGMRQRAMIAMALACEPHLLIADEPTTALDVTVQAQILDLVKELTRETQSSLILITHDLGVVARYADRVAVMYAGRIVEIGTAADIYERPAHPYTVGLMASVPRLDSVAGSRLTGIDGQPPDLAHLPPGCAFAPRCAHVHTRCGAAPPALIEVEANHLAACYRHVS